MIKNSINPIEKGTPSVFVVGSPLQVMCAVEAIHDLEIKDYVFYAVMGNNARDNQIRESLNFFKIDYIEIEKHKDIYPYKKRLLILKSNNNRFQRAFVGGYGSMHHYFWAMRHLSDHSVILTLDDGVETVTLLQDKSKLPKPANKAHFINNILLWLAVRKRNIDLRKKLYTIYSDIKSNDFTIYSNSFSHIGHLSGEKSVNGVFFAGTTHKNFYTSVGIKEEDYYDMLDKLFQWIIKSYPDDRKVYIPHGTDKDERVKMMCINNGFEYIKPNCNIELFLCELIDVPRAVFGFTSSCLFNVKKMFKGVDSVNILIKINGEAKEVYETISNYYQMNGIQTKVYSFPEKNFL